jgi:putative hemolysin
MGDDLLNKDFKPINIREIFQAKNPRMAGLLPGFVYSYLHKALVLDDINEIMRLHGHKKDYEFAKAVIEIFNVTVDLIGENKLPQGGPFIFVANHPLGGFDGILLIHEIGERYDRKFRVLVNDILLNLQNMDGIFVPVNKHGGQTIKNVRLIEEIFQSDQHVMTFPSGYVSRRSKGKIIDMEWQKSFITKAVKHKRDVVPIHISGRCTNFFYNLANTRKFLGIKANLEMFFLPRETFRHKNNHYRITIGKSISYNNFDKRIKPAEWAEKVKEHCYKLENNPEIEFAN